MDDGKYPVYVLKTTDRDAGIRKLLEPFPAGELRGMTVAIKANFNSADPYPASTHPDTLSAIVDMMKANDVARITVAERSGMGETPEVLRRLRITDLAERKGFDLVVLDDLRDMSCWERQGKMESYHWKNGYLFAKAFGEADAIVATCCLKTHRFGGHFTMSLKNSVGMVAAVDPESGYDYMRELHGSPGQRQMIAEINTAYSPFCVVMDAIRGFSHGGPEKGTLIEPGLLLASADRVALDACGVAILRMYGTTPEVAREEVFAQEQIARAAGLGIGATGPDQVEVVPLNDGARDACRGIERQMQGMIMAGH
ncbi:MAG: hypothetical protein A4E28_02004 [Methanocella sp. PtaU1.Bin125]|nr:MAG: hypothetical protein A4E28_02004 [Methanocella sp. PtaU1.Bin125]